ncbi:MAG TPA: tetratricopeptide repeat protein, partial [Chitinophagaceae bacterium]|nr:tetratricopeptide repeat protein [Chitinophagaceae bacterium]
MERINKLNEMLKAQPHDSFLLHALGLEYIKIGELERAIESFEKVIAFNKNYVGTYYHMAQTFEKQNKFDKAIAIYQEGIQVATLVKDQHAKN